MAKKFMNEENFIYAMSQLKSILNSNYASLEYVKSNTTKDYNDLINKPTIPTVTNDLTDELKSNYDAAYEHSQSGTINMTCIDGFSGDLLVAHEPEEGQNPVFYSTKAYITSSGSIGTESNMNAKAFYENGISLVQKYASITNVLVKDNEELYIPISDYNPATKKYVDDSIIKDYNDLENKPFYDSGNNVILEIPAERMRDILITAKEENSGWAYFNAPNDIFRIMRENPDKKYYAIFDNKITRIEYEYDPDDYDYFESEFLFSYGGFSINDESGDWDDNEQSMVLEVDPVLANNVLSENITSLVLAEFNIKELDNKFIPSDLKVLNSISMGRKSYSDIGLYSTALGQWSEATGHSSFATGSGRAFGHSSHAEGSGTTANGVASHAEGDGTIANGYSAHAEGRDTHAKGSYSHTEGNYTESHGFYSHAEGCCASALGSGSHAEGYGGQYSTSALYYFKDIEIDDITNEMMLSKWRNFLTGRTVALKQGAHAEGRTTLAVGEGAHSEGWGTCALDEGAHSEGEYTTALGHTSHAEGNSTSKAVNAFDEGKLVTATDEEIIEKWSTKKFTLAKGKGSHSEGTNTLALGDHSHAEGYETTASAQYSHAEGCGTIARGDGQHVQGYYNIEDEDEKYIHIVGNGSRNTRSNAHTLDWNGNAWYAGDVYVGADNKKLITEDFVNNLCGISQEDFDLIASEVFGK